MSEILVRRFDAVPWARDVSPGNTPNEMLERAIENGYRRKRLLERDDAHLTYVEMGPGWVVPPHSHSTGEVIFLLEGSLTPDSTGEALHAGDSISVPAHASYGFTCGGEGVRFLVMRPGEATVTLDE